MADLEARRVIDQIRASTNGAMDKRLAQSLHSAIELLSAELYQKDLHFVMELVQNADDNQYPVGAVPELEFVMVNSDIARVGGGVQWTLLVLNNEVGFSQANVESLCSVGLSTKKRKRSSGFIGEKGIGFKSVFTVTRHPVVISNGYRFRFCDAPTHSSGFGYIVPEWAEHPTPECLSECVGKSVDELPTTILALPLRPEKVAAVRSQLRDLSPYLVPFLNQIDKLSTREVILTLEIAVSVDNADLGMSVQRRVLNKPTQKLRNGGSYSELRLSSASKELTFHVFEHKFPLSPSEHELEHRKDVLSRTITLAFLAHSSDTETELHSSAEGEIPSLFSFLPTKVDTALPFIINADFLLVSSRETIRLDSKWNHGILSQIPEAFMESFIFLLKELKPSDHRKSGVANMKAYQYIPTGRSSSLPEFKTVREKIIEMLKSHDTVLCEVEKLGQQLPSTDGHLNFFCKPFQARKMDSSFRSLLKKAHKEGIPAPELLKTQSVFIVDSKLEKKYFNKLTALGIEALCADHYVQCVKSSRWLASLPEELYLELLYFISIKTGHGDFSTQLKHVPLFKYVETQGIESFTKFFAATEKEKYRVYLNPSGGNFLSNWATVFSRWFKIYFIPDRTFKAFENHSDKWKKHLTIWLETFSGIESTLTVDGYGALLMEKCEESSYYNDRSFVLNTFQYFLDAFFCGELSLDNVRENIVNHLPLIDDYDQMIASIYRVGSWDNGWKPKYKYTLLPASVCEGPKHIIQNSWRGHVLCLSESYLWSGQLSSGVTVSRDNIICFLKKTLNAVNISEISDPPNVHLSIMDDPAKLSLQDVASLLVWLKTLKNIPDNLKKSFEQRSWVKTVYHGYMRPSMCVLSLSIGGWHSYFLKEDLPVVDEGFYGSILHDFKELLGIKFGMVLNASNGGNMVAGHISRVAAEKYIVSTGTAQRWYRYLRDFSWMGWKGDTSTALIWLPRPYPGKWVCAKDCVVRDSGGLFKDRLVVLSEYYEDSYILGFFHNNMGVMESPGTKAYSSLWLDWCRTSTMVEKKKCQNLWKIMTKDWENAHETKQRFVAVCKIPCSDGNEGSQQVELVDPKKVLYADNIILAELFNGKASSAAAKLKFAWYPRSAAEATWVEKLVNKCYMELGVKKLSEVVNIATSRKCVAKSVIGKGMNVTRGLARVILGYLANPKHNVEQHVRERLVSELCGVQICHVEELGEMLYNVNIGGITHSASRKACVSWDKKEKRIYVLNLGNKEISSTINRLQIAMEISAEIAKGVLGGTYQALVEGLQQLLLLAVALDFEDASAKLLISTHKLRLTLEDEALLEKFPDHPNALFKYK